MKPNEYRDLLTRSIPHKRRTLAVSPPGVGKTTIAGEVCRDLGYEHIVMCLPLDDPSTIRGYPRPPAAGSDGDAVHCLFDGMAKAFRATRPTVLNFDDIGQASESTLKAVMRIVQFGELDGKQLPECVTMIGATNDVGHGAGVVGMIEPLKSRFHTIIHVETDLDDVITFGLAKGWPAWLCAYLRNSPQSLNTWKPAKSMDIDGSCPRGWHYAAEWFNIGEDNPEVIAGCVGKGEATACLAFKELQADLPDLDAIVLDPDGAPVPENPSARFLVSMGIASKLTAGNFGPYLRYMNRLPAMFRAFGIRDAFRAEAQKRKDKTLPKDHKNLAGSRDFTAWACSDDGKAVMSAAA